VKGNRLEGWYSPYLGMLGTSPYLDEINLKIKNYIF